MNMKIVIEPLRNSSETLEFLKSDNLKQLSELAQILSFL